MLKNYRTFYQKNCQKALKNMVLGSEIRDPEKTLDPGSGSATLEEGNSWSNNKAGLAALVHKRATVRYVLLYGHLLR